MLAFASTFQIEGENVFDETFMTLHKNVLLPNEKLFINGGHGAFRLFAKIKLSLKLKLLVLRAKMPRTKPTLKLGVYGSFDINPEKAVTSYFESKLQEKLY